MKKAILDTTEITLAFCPRFLNPWVRLCHSVSYWYYW